MKIVLISCASKKSAHRAKAQDLYVSQLFKKSLQYARLLKPGKIFILSAKHGLVALDKEIDPYEKTLNKMTAQEKKEWSQKIKEQINGQIDIQNDEIIFLAGGKYRDLIINLFKKTETPMEGLGIGKQLQFLNDKIAAENKCDCGQLHKWANGLQLHRFPFNGNDITLNGIYILFEKGESAHGTNRIVRIGTHTGANQLRARLKEHFLTENKDRSIFRKNIGRCILNRKNDEFLRKWEIDLTTRAARQKYASSIDAGKLNAIEKQVSTYIKDNFSFVVLPVENKKNRLELESKIISTVSLCNKCSPSKKWLGLSSPVKKIRESGLWLVNELYRRPLSNVDFEKLKKCCIEDT